MHALTLVQAKSAKEQAGALSSKLDDKAPKRDHKGNRVWFP